MPDQPYPAIQAKEIMNPLPGISRQAWQELPEDERKRLILESRAAHLKEKGNPPEGRPVARGTMPQLEQVGTTPSGEKVVRQVSKLRGIFEALDEAPQAKAKE